MKPTKALPLSCLFLTACFFAENNQSTVKLTETQNTISFPIAQNVNIYSRCYRHYTKNDDEFIALATNHYNKDYDEIVIYNLKSSEEAKRIPIYKKGINSIGCELCDFDIINGDTIVCSNAYKPQYHFTDSNGHIISSLKLNIGTCSGLSSMINIPFAMLNDSTIEFPQSVSNRSPLYPNPPDFKFSDHPLAYLINVNNGDATPSKVTFPELYKNDENGYHRETYSRIHDNKNFVYAFFAYDSLIVTSDHKTAKTFCAKSKHIGNVKNPGAPHGTSIPDLMKLTLIPHYGSLVFDPHREVYYRFCYFENDYPGPYTLEYTLSGGAFTIMIIDKEFNVIGETVFPDKRYASKIFFVNKDGLWLSENHFLREDMTDDKLVFRCLKLEYFQS